VNIFTTLISENEYWYNTFFRKVKQHWKFVGLEASIWILGLLYLIFIHSPAETHFTICPLSNLGFEFCPGCGLGNSISYLFRGDFVSSFHSHPLGIFALIIISFRIITIIKNNRRKYA
jgi:lipoprotein signal peptidase